MKKTLLSLFAALTCMSAASAAEVTFDFTTADAEGKSMVSLPITMRMSQQAA